MSLWLTEVFARETIAQHAAMFLVVVALAMPTVGLVRLMALIAGVVGVGLSAFYVYDPIGLFWWSLVVVVALARLATASGRRPGRSLTGEQRLFHEKAVPMLSTGQARRLIEIGRWREVMAGTALTRAGEAVSELCFVTRGQVDIVVDGKKVAECGPGTLVGEIGMSTGEPATATAICATPVRYLSFEAKRLYRLLDSHVELQDAVELAIERSLREKLNRSNIAAAHHGGGAVG
ncbi:MAG: cyclic nucleotide-binding domain-containing protein [Bauldia sp.]